MTPKRPTPPPIALTIAGSDSGGGAGIQADLKTFEALGVFGTSAITAITAQNTVGVEAAVALDPSIVAAQIRAVAADLRPAAAKTGMLANAGIVAEVAATIEACAIAPLVVDPVMVATSGDPLLDDDAVGRLAADLLPLARLVTPNVPEAARLAGMAIRGTDDMRAAARRLVEMGAGAALVKGGHLEGAEVVDVMWDGAREVVYRAARIARSDTHGTGCTLSAAVTAGLACGAALPDAVARAIDYTRRAIENAPGLGHGRGPLGHRAASNRGARRP